MVDPVSTIDPAATRTRDPLVIGPVLRYVGAHEATVWVETSRTACVEVRAGDAVGSEMTFTVAGHTYALVAIRGLRAGTATPYEIRVDGELVWPDAASAYPPSVIRTIDATRPMRFVYGSCRAPTTVEVKDPLGTGDDVLDAFARRLAGAPMDEWPEALLLLGDQVYADETSPETQAFIRARRDVREPPHLQVADFEEYTRLYAETWGDPDVRWLLSVLPSTMIFDDHDVLDDWNTSRSWRDEITATSWWRDRIGGALMSYWIYQHLGNLSPDELAANDLYREIRAAADGESSLRAFAETADREPDGGPGILWSYRRDFGRVRLLVIDSRCGRVLTEGHRQMVSDPEFDWIEAQVEDGDYDHLLVATSVPWLLPRALHDLEAADEGLTAGSRGRLVAKLAELLRRKVDLEHWAAFGASFERLAALFERIGRGDHGAPPPATIAVLSGDVHHTYVSEATLKRPVASRVYQLTCSPLHNSIPLPMRGVFKAAWSGRAERSARALLRFARVTPASITWKTSAGPFFGNHLGALTFHGRDATFELHHPVKSDAGPVTELIPEARRDLAAIRPRAEVGA